MDDVGAFGELDQLGSELDAAPLPLKTGMQYSVDPELWNQPGVRIGYVVGWLLIAEHPPRNRKRSNMDAQLWIKATA
ncbi:TPA: hypothetical protein ACUNF5_007607, partial [Burkholderia orbicola]